MGFQKTVNAIQAPAVEGDFASANPRGTVLAGEGALVSGFGVIGGVAVGGIVMGRFGWTTYGVTDNDNAPGLVNTYGAGLPAGLVHRSQQGWITPYLAEASLVLPTGFQTSLFNNGDFWVVNRGAAVALKGQKAFAVFADGSATFAAAGATPAGGSGSASSIAAGSFTVTGSATGDIFTAASGLTGSIYPGATIAGTGISTGTKIVNQVVPLLPGEALNGLGRYTMSIPEQSAVSTAITGSYGILTVGGTVVAGFGPGQTVTGGTIAATTTIYQQLTGTPGAAGTYVVDVATVVGSAALTSASSVETKWIAQNAAAVGELVKISNII